MWYQCYFLFLISLDHNLGFQNGTGENRVKCLLHTVNRWKHIRWINPRLLQLKSKWTTFTCFGELFDLKDLCWDWSYGLLVVIYNPSNICASCSVTAVPGLDVMVSVSSVVSFLFSCGLLSPVCPSVCLSVGSELTWYPLVKCWSAAHFNPCFSQSAS